MKDYPEPPKGLAVEHDGNVLRARLDRPERRNALTDEMVLALIDTIEAAGSDESVRVIELGPKIDSPAISPEAVNTPAFSTRACIA